MDYHEARLARKVSLGTQEGMSMGDRWRNGPIRSGLAILVVLGSAATAALAAEPSDRDLWTGFSPGSGSYASHRHASTRRRMTRESEVPKLDLVPLIASAASGAPDRLDRDVASDAYVGSTAPSLNDSTDRGRDTQRRRETMLGSMIAPGELLVPRRRSLGERMQAIRREIERGQGFSWNPESPEGAAALRAQQEMILQHCLAQERDDPDVE